MIPSGSPAIGVFDTPDRIGEDANIAYAAEYLGRLTAGQSYEIVGQINDCEWLQVRWDEDDFAWLRYRGSDLESGASGQRVELNVTDCAQLPQGTFRPHSGMILNRLPSIAFGNQLYLENNASLDGWVLLVLQGVEEGAEPTGLEDQVVYGLYVRSEDTLEVIVTPGIYWIYYVFGQGWSIQATGFQQADRYGQFPEEVTYSCESSVRAFNCSQRGEIYFGTGDSEDAEFFGESISPDDFPGIPEG